MITGELRNQVDKLWTEFWTGGIANPLMVIEQIWKVIKAREALIKQQFEELGQTFPGIGLYEDIPGRWVIRGTLSFSATFKAATIADSFSILILLPEDYPKSPPDVQETGGRIPADFHQYPDRTLCLGAPVEVQRRFNADPRIVAFVETLLIEYLYGYAYFEKYGSMPFGELSHGAQGIREYYKEIFDIEDVQITLALLKIMADSAYRGHHPCPCGSGKILRKCHGSIMLRLIKHQPEESDVMYILDSLKQEELANFDWEPLPKELKRQFKKMLGQHVKLNKKMKRFNPNIWILGTNANNNTFGEQG